MKHSAALALVMLCSACAGRPGSASDAGTWRYDVEVLDGGARLRVTGTLDPAHTSELSVAFEAEPFVSSVALRHEDQWRPLERQGTSWFLPSDARTDPTVVRWEFDVDGAARRFRSVSRATEHRKAWLAPPSTWLLRPLGAPGDVRVTVQAAVSDELAFVSGILRGDDPDSWTFAARHLAQLPFTAFGRMRVERARVGDSEVDVALLGGNVGVEPDRLVAWAVRYAQLVGEYFGRFPVANAAIILAPGRPGIGRAMGNGGASVFFPMSRSFDERDMATDWVLMHELTHIGVPQLSERHHWFEEGVATYVEPLIRVRAGIIDEQKYWRELMRGLPNGLPVAGDEGLDRTHTWGRTYWGGALFCFLADLEIRRKTGGARSLDDALRHVVAEGGSIAWWQSMERVMKTADRGTGESVLWPLYGEMSNAPYPVDLDAIWTSLGVRLVGSEVRFDEDAPENDLRVAMTSPAR